MKNFKKRTIALVLASVVTVAGSFASDNYKNSIMALSFEGTGNNINMVLETKKNYSSNIKPIQKDAHTYILMLPEVESQAPTPDLSQVKQVESVNVRTMPYTTSGKGYTKITIKTLEPVNLSAENRVFIATEAPALLVDNQVEDIKRQKERAKEEAILAREMKKQQEAQQRYEEEQAKLKNQPKTTAVEEKPVVEENVPAKSEEVTQTTFDNDNKVTSEESVLLALAILLVLVIVAFFALRARNKLNEIAGEKFDINDDNEKKSKKAKEEKTKKTSIRKTIKTLDSAYPQNVTMPGKSDFNIVAATPVTAVEEEHEEVNIVDLDELYQEKTKTEKEVVTEEDEENSALEEFLSGFSFDEDFEEQVEENTPGYDVEFLEQLLSSDIKFTQDDIGCFKELLSNEIQDDTLKNVDKYLATNPIKVSQKKALEELVTTYTISQNITFSSEDISVLNKLINVEIDNDFVTDLKTNPERTKEMYKEIQQAKEEYKKPSEIITLNVKDMLPDLSEALRKQGGKKIESEARAETVYFSEGYEVSKLAISDLLPDLTKELNNKDAYISKPSAEIQYADSNYEVQTLSIKDELPDLNDAMENPDKYNKVEEKEVIVDEESLLKNITGVQFKPFDDGTREFEVINDFPSVSDIQKEFSQFGNFEISDEEQYEKSVEDDSRDDGFDGLFNNEYVDLDSVENQDKSAPEVNHQETLDELLSKDEQKNSEFDVNETANETVAQVINQKASEAIKEEIRGEARNDFSKSVIQEAKEELTAEALNLKYVIDGKTYTVLDKAEFDSNAGCYLAKQDSGYSILSYVGENVAVLHSYETLKSEKISVRVGETISDNNIRYIIRAGSSKFIADYNNGNISYVMDLC